MIYIEIKKDENIIFSNVNECSSKDILKLSKNVKIKEKNIISNTTRTTSGLDIWIISENDIDLLNSNRLFKKNILIYEKIADSMYNNYLKKIELNSHTIRTIQAKMAQKIDSFMEEKEFISTSYKELLEKVTGKIDLNVLKAADLICQLNNRVKELSFHMESLDLLYYNRDDKIIFSESNLKKIILKALTPFQNSFNKKSIKISLFVEETFMINTNYELFNLIMHHFFHNTEKYTKESTTIHLNISKDTKNYLLIDMISLHIENKAKIFEEGYSGENTDELAGNGIGMYVIKKGLNKLGMDIIVKDEQILGDYKYRKNTFVITLN